MRTRRFIQAQKDAPGIAFSGLFVGPAPQLRRAEVDSEARPFDQPAVLGDTNAVRGLGIGGRASTLRVAMIGREVDLGAAPVVRGREENRVVGR